MRLKKYILIRFIEAGNGAVFVMLREWVGSETKYEAVGSM